MVTLYLPHLRSLVLVLMLNGLWVFVRIRVLGFPGNVLLGNMFLAVEQSSETDISLDLLLALTVRGSKTNLAKNLVHLLESTALGLRNVEVDEEHTYNGDNAEEDECTELGSLNEGRCGDGHGEVVQPVAGSTNRYALCTHAQWEDLRDDDPGNRAP
jgi:hypothetical protein